MDRLVNQGLCVLAPSPLFHDDLNNTFQLMSHQTICPSLLSSLMNKTLRYLNCSTWSSNSTPTQREQTTLFWQKTMASDPEVLVLPESLNIKLQLIPVPVEGHGTMKPTEPHHQRKTRRVILYTLSSPWLSLEILSMNIRNRIVDKGESNTCLNWAQLYAKNANTALT